MQQCRTSWLQNHGFASKYQSNGSPIAVVESAALPALLLLRDTFLLTVLETALPRCNAVLESRCVNADVARMISWRFPYRVCVPRQSSGHCAQSGQRVQPQIGHLPSVDADCGSCVQGLHQTETHADWSCLNSTGSKRTVHAIMTYIPIACRMSATLPRTSLRNAAKSAVATSIFHKFRRLLTRHAQSVRPTRPVRALKTLRAHTRACTAEA